MRDFTVKARIVAEDDASSTIGKVESRFSRLTSFLRSNTVVTFGDVANVVGRAVDFFGSFIQSAQESEDAVNRLSTALGDLGPATARVNRELVEQATALQATSRFGDEQILAAQALLLNLGATADQVPRATEAAVELAAAFRTDLNTAAQLVGRTLQGVADRSIARLLPALKDLDAETLKAGAGVDLILDRFGGAAAADLETFSGQVASLGNAFDDLREKIGGSIVGNEQVRESFARIREIFADPAFVAAIETVTSQLTQFVEDLVQAGETIPNELRSIGDFFSGLSQLFDFDDATEGVAAVSRETNGLFQNLIRFGSLGALFDFIPIAGELIRNVIGAFRDWVLAITAAGEMMRNLGVETTTTEGSTAALGGAATATAQSTDALGASAEASARKVAALRAQLDAATAAANRLRAAQAQLAAAGPVSVQGAGTAPTRANTIG